ncbi:hypothetical protein JCM7686_2032 [Paracoccus aminophilus JCM 7686]|uniref:Yip1 domain-containing protein n=2 Tax=Paracoccus aminophilus TaxID=34003 RepID=S5YCF8_PARAH|nr:hypothetical protein JCM7686_2032 [Paracoccus aminophilus JCM 7686]
MSQPGMSQSGILPRVVRSWWAPAKVVSELRGMPDRVALVVLMAAMLITFISQLPKHARDAALDPSIPLQARIGGALLAVMFIMPVLAYGLASLVAALSRVTARPVTAQNSRLALFWALLAVSPLMLLTGLTSGLVGPGPALTLVQVLAGFAFLFIWGAGLRAVAGKS